MGLDLTNFYLGTSGLILPVANKQFYPLDFKDGTRLTYYASLTNSIEINSSFYKIPKSSTVKKWVQEVPENFQFTFKLFKEITHQKGIGFDPKLVETFFNSINVIGDKKGCLLIQFPPSVRIGQFKQLDFLFSCIKNNNFKNQWNIAVEFRHSSLYMDEVYELLDFHKFGLVIHDKSPANSPIKEDLNNFVYLRFHGPNGNYRDSYDDNILQEYATYITSWLNDDKRVYVYFNNTMGQAHANLNTLRKFVIESN